MDSAEQRREESSPPGDEPEKKEREKREREREEDEVYEKSAAAAHIVYKAILKEADEELSRPTMALAWSGLAAGLSMGFSLVGEGLLRSHLPDVPWRPLVSKLGYSLGFLIVILGRQQLFTENTLTPILPLLKRKDLATFWNVLRLWAIVLLTNLIGTACFAYAVQRSSAFDENTKAAFLQIGNMTISPSFATLVIKGIFAGWLIALMVWLLPVAETGRIAVIILLTYIVGLGQLSHVIAGSVEALYTVAAGQSGWGAFFGHYFVPTLLGNCIGGVALVAVINYAQVMAGAAEEPEV
jgi:formate/nitrite transporter FocA (FNT family)